MIQKVIKIGSSVGITIPKHSLKQLGLKVGDEIALEINTKARRVSFEPVSNMVEEVSVGVDKEVLDWTKKFIKRYRKALDELSNK